MGKTTIGVDNSTAFDCLKKCLEYNQMVKSKKKNAKVRIFYVNNFLGRTQWYHKDIILGVNSKLTNDLGVSLPNLYNAKEMLKKL